MAILTVNAPTIEWEKIRLQTKAILVAQPLLSGVDVFPSWDFTPDVDKAIGYIRSLNESSTIRAFLIGIQSAQPLTNDRGQNSYMGTRIIDWNLTVAFWGFWDYQFATTIASGTQWKKAENESRAAAAAIFTNSRSLGLETPDAQAILEVFPPTIPVIDTFQSSQGLELIISQCSFQVRVRDEL